MCWGGGGGQRLRPGVYWYIMGWHVVYRYDVNRFMRYYYCLCADVITNVKGRAKRLKVNEAHCQLVKVSICTGAQGNSPDAWLYCRVSKLCPLCCCLSWCQWQMHQIASSRSKNFDNIHVHTESSQPAGLRTGSWIPRGDFE